MDRFVFTSERIRLPLTKRSGGDANPRAHANPKSATRRLAATGLGRIPLKFLGEIRSRCLSSPFAFRGLGLLNFRARTTCLHGLGTNY